MVPGRPVQVPDGRTTRDDGGRRCSAPWRYPCDGTAGRGIHDGWRGRYPGQGAPGRRPDQAVRPVDPAGEGVRLRRAVDEDPAAGGAGGGGPATARHGHRRGRGGRGAAYRYRTGTGPGDPRGRTVLNRTFVRV